MLKALMILVYWLSLSKNGTSANMWISSHTPTLFPEADAFLAGKIGSGGLFLHFIVRNKKRNYLVSRKISKSLRAYRPLKYREVF